VAVYHRGFYHIQRVDILEDNHSNYAGIAYDAFMKKSRLLAIIDTAP
jgi:hypothetical protein